MKKKKKERWKKEFIKNNAEALDLLPYGFSLKHKNPHTKKCNNKSDVDAQNQSDNIKQKQTENVWK